ncbi:MAG TPA: hypothetical protein VHA57_00545 [Actinomycetota bacterium]|nr:hypothetical protein [Actinomycetota bacterium]
MTDVPSPQPAAAAGDSEKEPPAPAPRIIIPKITTSPRLEAAIDLDKLSKLLDDLDEG